MTQQEFISTVHPAMMSTLIRVELIASVVRLTDCVPVLLKMILDAAPEFITIPWSDIVRFPLRLMFEYPFVPRSNLPPVTRISPITMVCISGAPVVPPPWMLRMPPDTWIFAKFSVQDELLLEQSRNSFSLPPVCRISRIPLTVATFPTWFQLPLSAGTSIMRFPQVIPDGITYRLPIQFFIQNVLLALKDSVPLKIVEEGAPVLL